MIGDRTVGVGDRGGDRSPGQMRDPIPLTRTISLRWRVTLLAAAVVGVSMVAMGVAAYGVIFRASYAGVDEELKGAAAYYASRPPIMIPGSFAEVNVAGADALYFHEAPEQLFITARQFTAIGEPELAVLRGQRTESIRTVDNRRIYARKLGHDAIVVERSLADTDAVVRGLAGVLIIVGGCGIILAAVAGTVVARGGLRPVARLQRAVERVARTDDLRPIPVTGDDELAKLTVGFNTMLRALTESRERQGRLVADAGHELRTPLTSMRTNIELLIASSRPGAPTLAESDMTDLRQDILAQIEELSQLVGDLVDLARDDQPTYVREEIDVEDLVLRQLERARRRRADVEFTVTATPWFVYGEAAPLARAVLNVLDNAAKWSPSGGLVDVRLEQTGVRVAELCIADAGPGIDPSERELVFDRFYRTTAARSMPGSGLGLAIVKQSVERLGGTVSAEESLSGGALIRIVLPGSGVPGDERVRTVGNGQGN